jgi:hypothetical protein
MIACGMARYPSETVYTAKRESAVRHALQSDCVVGPKSVIKIVKVP